MGHHWNHGFHLRREHIFSAVLLASTSLILLGLLEVALRLLYGTGFPITVSAPAYHLDGEEGLRLNAGMVRTFKRDIWNGGQTIIWKTNSAGYRGPELMPEREYRIALFGDSNIQAEFSQLENTYAMVLQRTLQERTGRIIEVVNAGTVGAGPDQNLSRMSRELPVLRPQLVILHVFADNDFGDLVRNALFSTDSGGSLVRTSRQFERDQAFDVADKRHTFALMQFASNLQTFLHAQRPSKAPQTPAEFIASKLEKCALEFETYQSLIAGKNVATVSVLDDHYDYDLALYPELQSSRTKVKLMEGVLRRAKQIANANGVALVLLIEPSVRDLSDNNLITPRVLRAYSSHYRQDGLTSIVRDISIRNQIDFVNLFPFFAARAPLLYFRGEDDHWNDDGQAYAARLTADALASRIASSFQRSHSTP